MDRNDKFVWRDGDLKVISKEEFEESAVKYQFKTDICAKNVYCKQCDKAQKAVAEQIAGHIFQVFFVDQPYDESIFRRVMQNLSSLCKKVIGQKCVLTKELYYCIKSILIFKIKGKTTIQITPEMVEELLK